MRYIAHFTPEVWIGDNAVEVSVQGPDEWDCTEYAAQHPEYTDAMKGWDGYADERGDTDRDDVFKGDPAAPQWVQDWTGPFTIRVRESESA